MSFSRIGLCPHGLQISGHTDTHVVNRYRVDPKTGHPVPVSGGSSATPALFAPHGTPPSSERASAVPSDMIDPRLISAGPNATPAAVQRAQGERGVDVVLTSEFPRLSSRDITAFTQAGQSSMPPPRAPAPAAPSRFQQTMGQHRTGSSGALGAQRPKLPETQITQVLEQLTTISQNLLTACAEMTHAVREQTAAVNAAREEANARAGSSSQGKESEGLSTQQRVNLAMELLTKDGVGDPVRTAAAEYLKKLFMNQ